jgi:hypothetical protein
MTTLLNFTTHITYLLYYPQNNQVGVHRNSKVLSIDEFKTCHHPTCLPKYYD